MVFKEEDITYELKDKFVVITLNAPKKFNALDGAGFIQLTKYVEEADNEEESILTIIQSSGRFFTAGADINAFDLTERSHDYWLKTFLGLNTWMTDVFHNHTKILVAAINGPAIGAAAGLVALCDLIYVMEESRFSLQFPFARLGLVAEGATSASLFIRLGWSKSAEALLLAKPVSGAELNKLGFINKTYDGQFKTVEAFNENLQKELHEQFKGLDFDAILQIKQLLKFNRDTAITSSSAKEAVKGFGKWIEGVSQEKIAVLVNKTKRKTKI